MQEALLNLWLEQAGAFVVLRLVQQELGQLKEMQEEQQQEQQEALQQQEVEQQLEPRPYSYQWPLAREVVGQQQHHQHHQHRPRGQQQLWLLLALTVSSDPK